jgi:hypothetical protein
MRERLGWSLLAFAAPFLGIAFGTALAFFASWIGRYSDTDLWVAFSQVVGCGVGIWVGVMLFAGKVWP